MLFQGSFKLWMGKHYACVRANRDDKSYSTRRHAEAGIVFLQKGFNRNRCSCVKNGVNCASFCFGCHRDCCNTKEESLDLDEDEADDNA